MGAIIHRVCWLDETVQGHPKPSQFTLGDIDAWSNPENFYIAYGGLNPHWPGGGMRPRYLAWKHSSNLYVVFCGRGPGNARRDWLEDSPRNGLRGYPYCEQGTHDWRWFRASGWDNTDPENPVWIQERMWEFGAQPPAPSTITPSTPWEIGDYEIHEIIPSIPVTIAGFDLPEYTSHVSDETNGDEID